MRLTHTLGLCLGAALLLAACGSQNGPSMAEQNAEQSISGVVKVASYPIALDSALSYLPSAERGVGTPAYIFTVQVSGKQQPLWVVAGAKGARELQTYPSIAAAAAHAGAFDVPAKDLAAIGDGALGKIKLTVIGVGMSSASGAKLAKLGLHVGSGTYPVVDIVSLPPHASATSPGVAHFVLRGGKVVGEYGSSR